MDSADPLPRSPELMSGGDTGLLVVDVQEKLIRLLPGHARIIWSIRRLIEGAKLLKLPVLATEQYPERLGGTVAELAARLPRPLRKPRSVASARAIGRRDRAAGNRKMARRGIETHVCVQQTVIDLLSAGYRVFWRWTRSAAGRNRPSHGPRPMESAGATLTTVEAALFEWCGDSSRRSSKRSARWSKNLHQLNDFRVASGWTEGKPRLPAAVGFLSVQPRPPHPRRLCP